MKKIKEWLDPSRMHDLHEDRPYMPDVEAAIHNSGARFAYIMTVITAASIILLVTWAAFAVLDEVTKGDAQVIPSSKIQLLQSLEGGVVTDIMVHEGDIVQQNQVLVKIDNILASSDLNEKQERYNYLQGTLARLQAEVNGTTPEFPEELKKVAPRVVSEQINQYNTWSAQTSAEISVLSSQVTQRSQEVREMQARLSQLRSNLQLKEQEMNLKSPLVAQGAISKVELLRIEGEVTDLRGEINTIATALPRANAAVNEANQHIAQTRATKRAEAQSELAANQAEMASLKETLNAGADKVKRTQLRSPVKGTVKQIKVNTVGGVIKPGEDVMEIVPLNDTLLIEAKIPPKDIAFIRPGQKALVKITAYDYSIFGGLDGMVEGISADTIQNEKNESFYRVNIRTKETTLLHKGKELPIIPGMTANVQIMTGRKSVLDYLLKPVMKARQEALRER